MWSVSADRDVDFDAAQTHLFVDTDVQDVLAPLAVLDESLGSRPDAAGLGHRRTGSKDRGGEDCLQVVGGRGSSVGSGDGSLLQTVQLKVGLTQRLGDLELQSLGHLLLQWRREVE